MIDTILFMKKIPEKIHRYLVFGEWLCQQIPSSSKDDLKRIQDLFHINSSIDEQIIFYTKFHEDYNSIDKEMSLNVKRTKREQNKLKRSCNTTDEPILVNDCESVENKKPKCELYEDNFDYIWEMDDDFYNAIKEMV